MASPCLSFRIVHEDGEDDDDTPVSGAPLPPDDRLWRHPSEVAHLRAPGVPPTRPSAWAAPRTVAIALVSGVLGAVLTVGMVAVTMGIGTDGTPRGVSRIASPAIDANLVSQSIPADGTGTVAKQLGASIVPLAIGATPTPGTAIVLRPDGYLLTEAALLGDATTVTATIDGHELTAVVIGLDPLTDVAVLHVDRTDLMPAATNANVAVGERAFVVAARTIGVPTVTAGVVNVLDRKVTAADGTVLHGMVQSDAPIDASAVGGALSDDTGAVLGLVTGPASSTGGYAVPIATAIAMANQIIADGRVHHPWLGVEGTDIDSSTAAQLHVSGGATVTKVADASPASDAGLQAGDVITAVGGSPVLSMSDLVVGLRAHVPGDAIDLEFVRAGAVQHCTATLAERSA